MNNTLPATIQKEQASLMLALGDWKIEVRNELTSVKAGSKLQDVMGYKKQLAKLKKQALEPLAEEEKRIREAFKTPESTLLVAEDYLKDQILKFNAVQKARLAEEQAKREAEAKKIEEDTKNGLLKAAEKASDAWDFDEVEELEQAAREVRVPVLDLIPVKTLPRGASEIMHYSFEIVNPDLIPREYWMLDEKKIGATVRALKMATNIPGIKVIEKPGLSVRA